MIARPKYLEKVVRLLDLGLLPKHEVTDVTVKHSSSCPVLRPGGKTCTCRDPEIWVRGRRLDHLLRVRHG